jgi:hypothetical protein
MRRRLAVFLAACLVLPLIACGDGSRRAAKVIDVAAGESIQTAVDQAVKGDVVLVAAGVYREQVVIDTAGVTLRGADRNATILDGGDSMDTGVLVSAPGVSVENLTVRNFTVNGVLATGLTEQNDSSQLDGFRMAWLTAHNNGLYGLYAFQAVNGTIIDSYVSGHPDSGIYVGQCGNAGAADTSTDKRPCNVVVQRVTAELNAIGYSGTNGSQVYVVESVFRNNRIGITPNSQSLEFRSPQTEAVIAGNLVENNDSPDAPEQGSGGFAYGIAIGSGVGNVVVKNRVTGHEGVGIAVTTLDRFTPEGNRVEANVLADNGIDLGYWLTGESADAKGNCFAGNTFATSSPADIERVMACGEPATLQAEVVAPIPSPQGPSYRDVPPPPDQPTMPGDVRSLAAAAPFALPSLDAIEVPEP